MPRSPRPASAGIAWRWYPLPRRTRGDADQRDLLADPPGGWPAEWVARVKRPQTREQREALALCIARGRPFGSPAWVRRIAGRSGLESTLRPRSRPRKKASKV